MIESFILSNKRPGLDIFIHQSKNNIGFAPGVNRAAELNPERPFSALFLLNSDAKLLSDFDLPKMTEILALNGVVGFKVFNDSAKSFRQKSARSFPSLITAVTSRQSLMAKLFPKNPWTQKYLGNQLDDQSTQKVDWVSGCALFCHATAWRKLGGFDEAFFFGVEDVDLGRKAQKIGIPVFFYPFIEILHIGGLAATRRAWKSDLYHHLGMWNYFIKWSNPFLFLFGPFIFLGIFLRFLSRRLVQIRTDF